MIDPQDRPSYWDRMAYALGGGLAMPPPPARPPSLLDAAPAVKEAAEATPSYAMTGLLYVSERSGKPWALLSVPNALVRGVFDALHAPGVELPLLDGKLDAHVSVLRDSELEMIGGPDALKNDRGKPFRYSLGRLMEFVPDGWADVNKCFAVTVHSPELQQLRLSHGLSALPKYPFHLTVGCVHKAVLGRNDKSKDTTAA